MVTVTLSEKNSSHKIVEILTWRQKFCPTKTFVRRKFCPILQNKTQAKIGKNCRNLGLVSVTEICILAITGVIALACSKVTFKFELEVF